MSKCFDSVHCLWFKLPEDRKVRGVPGRRERGATQRACARAQKVVDAAAERRRKKGKKRLRERMKQAKLRGLAAKAKKEDGKEEQELKVSLCAAARGMDAPTLPRAASLRLGVRMRDGCAQIIGFVAVDGQKVSFPNTISPKHKGVENWLCEVDLAIQSSVQLAIDGCVQLLRMARFSLVVTARGGGTGQLRLGCLLACKRGSLPRQVPRY